MVRARTIISDCLALITLGSAAIILKFGDVQPFTRGFYCYDSSLRHPYKSSTIGSSLALAVSVLVPLIYITSVEVILYINTRSEPLTHLWASWYEQSKKFSLGATTTVLLTSIGKLTIGRLRPHFLTVCRPDIVFSPAVCGTPAEPQYVTQYTCTGPEEEEIRDARLSFPSGHSSAAFYSCVYTILYLAHRTRPSSLTLLNQVGLFCYAWYCALTRVSDYKHHPTDVLAGGILGSVVAIAMALRTRSGRSDVRTEESELREKLLTETVEL